MVVADRQATRRKKAGTNSSGDGVGNPALHRKDMAPDQHQGHTSRRKQRAPGSVRARTYSTDPDRLLALIVKTGKLSFDYETRGLHPHASPDAQIGAIIAHSNGENFIFREFPEWWDEVLADKDTRKTGANLAFDLMWNIHETGIPKVRNIRDLMIEAQITHRYRTYSGPGKAFPHLQSRKALLEWEDYQPNDLASIIEETLGVKLKKGNKEAEDRVYHEDVWTPGKIPEFSVSDDGKITQKMVAYGVHPRIHKGVDWTGTWTPSMEEYMLEDIEHLEDAGDELDRRIKDEGQERVAWIENNSVFATAWMKYNGIKVDTIAWAQHIEKQREEAKHLLMKHLVKAFPGVTKFNSSLQMRTAMGEITGTVLPNFDKFTVKQLAPHYWQAAVYQDWKRLNTRIQFWGPEFLRKFICKIPGCGRIHGDPHQIGAETMRYSYSDPNLQQIPREADYRKLFIAEEGCWLASLDYSAIEVVTAAVFAQCPALLEACATGDPHLATAKLVTGDDTITKKHPARQNAKIANFGLLFGGGAYGLMTQARDLFDVHISEDEARQLIGQYYGLYPELKWSRNFAYRELDRQDGPVEVRTLTGMRRWLEGLNRKPTSILNTIIQSTAGHGIKSSFRYLMEAGLLPFLCLQVHDENIFEFPGEEKEDVEPLAELAHDCMMKGMKEVLGENAPVIVEWRDTIGKVWL